ncbi:hypothetical protein [Raoultibacter timonensis]|nr:hypothetical protein [Raoultibacter timonensis]
MEFIVDHKTLGDIPYAINLKGRELTRCRDCELCAEYSLAGFVSDARYHCTRTDEPTESDGYCHNAVKGKPMKGRTNQTVALGGDHAAHGRIWW